MLSNPTPEALIALEQVSKLPRWKDVNTMVEAELTVVFERMLGSADFATLMELKGRARALKEFQQQVAQAAEQLAKLGLRSPI